MPHRIVFSAPGRAELQPFDPGTPAPGQIGVRTAYSLVSIGTEMTILHGRYDPDSHFARRFSFPQLKTGVQAIGVVERVGGGVQEFGEGDLVYMRMAHGSHQVLNVDACSPVPPNVDRRSACWCGLAKTAFRAAWAGRFDQRDEVLIIGCGPVGQMTVRWAGARGVALIRVVDPLSSRLVHAIRGGATDTFDSPVQTLAQAARSGEFEPSALVVDTTGNPEVFRHALALVDRFGTLILLGDTGYPDRQRLTSDMMEKGLTVRATHDSHDIDGWTQRRIDELFFELLGAGTFNVDELITQEFSPAECARAYRLAEERRDEVMGILYDWTNDEW